MTEGKKPMLPPRLRTPLAAAFLLALGAAGGAGAVSLTRPAIEMAPTQPTPIARLAQTSGVVTVKGRVAEAYGDRFVVQDASGKALIDAGPEAAGVQAGSMLLVQGRYIDGQLRASYLVDGQGSVTAVGGPPMRGPGMAPPPPPGGAGVPPPLAAGPGAPPPPPPGALPDAPPPAAGAVPPPVAGTAPPTPAAGAVPPPPVAGAAVPAQVPAATPGK
jgi:hypothetical protein